MIYKRFARWFIIFSCALYAVILSAPEFVYSDSSAPIEIMSLRGTPAPVYPRNADSLNSMLILDANKKYKAVKYIKNGYLINIDEEPYIASSSFFAPAFLFSGGSEHLNVNADDFFKLKLPKEVDSSEFFFTSAERKSFYSLAFILFIKFGADYKDFEKRLQEFDDFLPESSKKERKKSFTETLGDYLEKNKILPIYFSPQMPRIEVIEAALTLHKPVVFISNLENPSGEIITAYSANAHGNMLEVSCYGYGFGLKIYSRDDFELLLSKSFKGFLVIL